MQKLLQLARHIVRQKNQRVQEHARIGQKEQQEDVGLDIVDLTATIRRKY
jgi:hypothetical protein